MESTSGMPRATTERGLGLAVTVREEVVHAAAAAAEASGYHSFWLNNLPRTDALSVLGAVSRSVQNIHLGVGVVPLSDTTPLQIAGRIRESGLQTERLYLGIGSGSGGGGVERVAEGIRTIRSEVKCDIVVAALGPRMCRLAGGEADGVLLNWLTPEYARQSINSVREAAEEAGRTVPRIMTYVRVALGSGALARLQREAANYEAIPHYGAHFKRMGVTAVQTAVTGDTSEDIQRGLQAWNGVVDEVVVRAITEDDSEEHVMRLLEAARPQ